MAKINLELSQSIHESLVLHIRENYVRYYYLAFSFVKNREAAEKVVTNAIYFSLYNGRTLKSLPPMQTWILQLIVKDGMRTMTKNLYERDFTKDSKLYAYMETLDPSATNVFKLYYFEDMNLPALCNVLHFNESEATRRLTFVRRELEIETDLDEESAERLKELQAVYESVELPESFEQIIEDTIKKEEDNFATFYEKYQRNRVLKPIGVVILAALMFFATVYLGRQSPEFAEAVLRVPFVNQLFAPFF